MEFTRCLTMANKVLICVFGAARCYCKQKKMDANLQFWPKIGDRVSYSGEVLGEKGKTSQFSIKEIKEEYPCTYYIIEDIKTHKQIRAFRPELSKANVVDEISTVNYGKRMLRYSRCSADSSNIHKTLFSQLKKF